jgi:diaminobutyrate-2-oxoglutarate transaminase
MTEQKTSVFFGRESEVRSYCRSFDTVFTSARGSLIRDDDGHDYIDFLAGCGSLNYGHNDPDMAAALIEHIKADGIALGLDLFTSSKRSFLESFETIILQPRDMDHRVQFTGPTGANAVEAALKLARKVTGRHSVIACTNGFHGVTLGALAATGSRLHRMGAPMSGVSRVPFDGYFGPNIDTADMLEQLLADPSSGIDAPAAILLETVQGEGGLNVASPEWLQRVSALAKQHGALLVIDDIQAGCGRTGTFFSFETTQVLPDIVTLSKSISGFGLPMAIVLIRPEYDVWQPAEHNGTFRGNTHAFVTARIALEKFWLDQHFARDIVRKSALLTERLAEIAAMTSNTRIKGRGMMQGLDVGSGDLADEICRRCFASGLIIETSGPHDEVVKVLAPLTTPDEIFERGLAILRAAVIETLATTMPAVRSPFVPHMCSEDRDCVAD